MTDQERYLDLFRTYETSVRNKGFESAKEYEDSITDVDVQDKLRFCRVVRNYLAHGKDAGKFASPTADMTKFIEDTVYALDEGEIPVGKKMIPFAKCISESNTVADALTFMQKSKASIIPVFAKDGKVKGLFSYEDFARFFTANDVKISKTTKLSALPIKVTKGKVVELDRKEKVRTAFSYYQDGKVVIVTENKNACGIYICK